ncbi:response regulator transcription factor [Echinicola sp. CAU 1574]|uniref:Response regulator transcription factor n=1 Tax=Echinicola arenosa TaxID=2774144 RepID=A0ABR9AMS9_9BACT|nr:LytTR family DNA-binding domain-containing protein [Echinicola arenosa]MBD8489168.1 response regulator transcription factor [Echinicola arenosa]
MNTQHIKIGLVDDEKPALDILKKLIEETPNAEVIFYTTNPDQVLELCEISSPDVLIIDIHMPGFNGIVLSGIIKSKNIPVILTSGHPLDAREAFEVDALDFLSKPISIHKLSKALFKVNNHAPQYGRLNLDTSPNPDYVFVKANKGYAYIKINTNDIMFIKASGHYADIFTKTFKYTSNLSMEELSRILTNTGIIRVHKSYLVNLDNIKSISSREIILAEKNLTVPIGETFRKNIHSLTKSKTI